MQPQSWRKRLFGKEGLIYFGISILFSLAYKLLESIFMNYVTARLEQHGVVFNKAVEYAINYPLATTIIVFFIVLGTLLVLDYLRHKDDVIIVPQVSQIQYPISSESVNHPTRVEILEYAVRTHLDYQTAKLMLEYKIKHKSQKQRSRR